MVKRVVLICGLLTMTISACGGSDAPAESGSPEALTHRPGPNWTPLKKVASAPQRVLLPTGPPPKKVVVRELKNGHGARLKFGDSFTANAVAYPYEGGQRLEKFWGKEAFQWAFGPGRLIKGWVIGLKGMRVGGRRELVIPSKLAYGDGARIYVIELLKVVEYG